MRHESTYFPTPQKGGGYRPFPFKGREFAIITLKLVPFHSRFFHFGARPALRKGDAQFRAGNQTACIRHHAPTGILHHAVAARQHLPGIEQGKVLRNVFRLRCALRMQCTHYVGQTCREAGLPVLQPGEIAARSMQPLHQRLPLPIQVLPAVDVGALHALPQLLQSLCLTLQLPRGVHQTALQIVLRLYGILQPVALRAPQVLGKVTQGAQQRLDRKSTRLNSSH